MYKVTIINDGVETVIHNPNVNNLKTSIGSFALGINVICSFDFTINMNNPGYSLIYPRKTLIKVYNTSQKKFSFEGYVLVQNYKMSDEGLYTTSYTCVDEKNFLKNSMQRHNEIHNTTPKEMLRIMLDVHNKQVEEDKRFVLGEVTVTNPTDNVYRYLTQDQNTWDAIFDKLIDRLGGELQVRKVNGVRYLDWLTEIGEVKETEIRVSKNLVNAEKEINTIDTYTRLIPLGARIESDDSSATDASEQRMTIASVNNGKDYIDDLEAQKKFGIIEGFIIFDEVTQPSILKSKGEAEIKSNSLVRSSNIITALDLSTIGKDIDSFEVGNYYPVVNPAISNELVRVIEKRGDINEPHKASLTIGDKTIRASQYQAEANQSKRLVKNLKESQARQVQRLAVISNNLNSLQTMTETEIAEIRQEISNLNIGSIENELNQILDLIANINLRLGNLEADSGWISVELGGGVTNSNLFIRNKHGTIFFKGSAVFPLASSAVKLANLNGFSTLENRTIEPKLIGQGTDRAQLTIRTDNTIYLEFSTAASKRYSFDSVVYLL
ncbi:Phage minor structural, N-terminal region domain protein [Carnobacterium maltaromaticum]|nr:Phage minor structural, N-terminal region domain protein [Carnobacterium maltaromaticum]